MENLPKLINVSQNRNFGRNWKFSPKSIFSSTKGKFYIFCLKNLNFCLNSEKVNVG